MIPTVLVPGLLCTPEVFGPQLPIVWARGPVTVANTLAGATMADTARAILAAAPPHFALGGISMGGYLCFEIWRQTPERVLRLALLDTTARPDTPDQTANRHAQLAKADSDGLNAVVAAAAPMLLHPDHVDDPALQAIGLRMGRAVGVDGFRRQTAMIIGRLDSRPSLASITVPTLVLVGDADGITPPDRAREMAAAIGGSRLVIVPWSGHSATLEQPEHVSRALADWLDEA